MIASGLQNVVQFAHLISTEGQNKCYVKYVFSKVFKNSIKLLTSPFPKILQTFFTRRALKGKLSTQRVLQEHCKGILKSAVQGHSGTQALGYLGTRGTRETLFSSLYIQ